MGHSAGGAFTLILLDRGFGAVGVGVNSAPTEGVKVGSPRGDQSSFPIVKIPEMEHALVGGARRDPGSADRGRS